MAGEEKTVAVLIADVCGSTPLYESSGNLKALSLIADCLDNIAQVVDEEGGTVLRSKGDDVLCTFPSADSAVQAASRMMEAQAGSPLEIHIGINYGPVVQDRGGIFGDVVNIAGRMQSMAKPGEIITTESVYQELSDDLRRQIRLLDSLTVKGKSEPMNVYAVFKDDTQVTYYVGEDGRHTVHPKDLHRVAGPKIQVTLHYGGRTIVRRDGGPGFHIGRAGSCDLIIDEALRFERSRVVDRASRESPSHRHELHRDMDRPGRGGASAPATRRDAARDRRELLPGHAPEGRRPDPHSLPTGAGAGR